MEQNSNELMSVHALSQEAMKLRLNILDMATKAGGGHIGGSFSVIEILTVLYGRILKHDPSHPTWKDRDRLIFSKGHSCLALYNVLAAWGYFPKSQLERYCVDGGILAGHPERGHVPGVEATTGSLGPGLSLAVGRALAAEIDHAPHRVFAVLSDGECNEGSTWEAFMAAAQHRLSRLTVVVDYNKLISLGPISEIMSLEPFRDRLTSFGWSVREVDGHDMGALVETVEAVPFDDDRPSAIIAHTVKGKGISFMENVSKWHYRGPSQEEFAAGRAELLDAINP